MEMTEDEIVQKYKGKPDKAMITLIADLNGTQPHVIEKILEKKGALVIGENTRSGKAKNTKSKKVDIKSEAVSVDTRSEEVPEEAPKYYPVDLIPDVVKDITGAKIRENRAKIEYHCEEINRMNDENNELMAFLKGESYGDENRVHWEVQDKQV